MAKTNLRAALALAALHLALSPARQGLAAQSFDRAWSVEVDCPDVGDVKGYNWRFAAQVTSGVLSGSYHSPTNQAMGNLSGRIRPDGEALLTLVKNRSGRSLLRPCPARNAVPLYRQRQIRRAQRLR